ncbi:hypothetical protein GCM10007067_25270 [Lysobacter bugurensis]|uniref:DUF2975 domain-containing protein n=1 Tax=Cognatilysobacter bugurensis TaxID=543356 RepID=A0A918T258_9GAMM|nr:hypothetical protein GCM10007067_25270 [Lysobacter bugurensis]
MTRVADFMLAGTVAALVLPTLFVLTQVPPAQVLRGELIVHWLAPVPYLVAVFAIRQAFAAYARGGVLGEVMVRACRNAGGALAIGAGISAFGVPLLVRWFATPAHPMSRTVMVFDVAYVAIGVVGLALVLLGGLIRRVIDVQERVHALGHELEEFV